MSYTKEQFLNELDSANERVLRLRSFLSACDFWDEKNERLMDKASDLLLEVEENIKAQGEIDELRKDLQFFMEQSVIIEHKQDHKQLRKLREKHGFGF